MVWLTGLARLYAAGKIRGTSWADGGLQRGCGCRPSWPGDVGGLACRGWCWGQATMLGLAGF